MLQRKKKRKIKDTKESSLFRLESKKWLIKAFFDGSIDSQRFL